jgi:S-adenosylmethionine hydrolase
MAFVLRASRSTPKSVQLETENGSTVTDMSVTVQIDYIDDNGSVVTSVNDTMPVWAGMSPEMKAGVQSIVDAMALQVNAKYFS